MGAKKVSQVDLNYGVFLSLKISLMQANSAGLDKMQHYAVFWLGLYRLPKYQLRGFQFIKGY